MPSPVLSRAAAFGAAAVLTCTLAVTAAPAATAAVVADPITRSAPDAALTLTPIGSYKTGVFDESAAEIVQAHGDRLFVVNAQAGALDVLDNSDPTAPKKLFSLTSAGIANSVAIRSDGLGVIAVEATDKTAPGQLVFFDADADTAASATLGAVTVGALPDMVTISDDGAFAVAANEGEPADDFSTDPEGSIAVVTLPTGTAAPAQGAVRIADFHAFEAPGALDDAVRVFGPTPEGADHPVSRNLEPEYITVSGSTAYATLQEANALAVVDLASATVTDIHPLGRTDLGAAANAIDASDRDGGYRPRTYPGLTGLSLPDAIDSYTANGTTYLVTANEGDAREWGTYVEGARVKDLGKKGLAPLCADSPLAGLTGDADLGRLNVSTEEGLDDAAGCYRTLSAFGGRSFSIYTTGGDLVWDSANAFEEITADALPSFFNSNHSASGLDGRSDDKGPEPESVTIGELSGRTYAFVGFERVGGVVAYDITTPASPTFVTYLNNRDFSQSVDDGGDLARAGDLGPESIAFIAAADSPNGAPLLAVGNEVSGTTTILEIEDALDPIDIDILTINDFHGRIEAGSSGEAGAAVLAGVVAAERAQNPNTLFVSAGDNIGASTFTSFIQQDDPTIDALVAAGLDVSAAGNHEFDGGFADLTDRVIPRFGGNDGASAPTDAQRAAGGRFALGANVYKKGTTTPALPEYTVQTVDGVRVAFIGTVTPDTATMVSPTGIAGIEFGDQLTAANRVAATLTAGDLADVIVLLTHSGTSVSDNCDTVASDPSDFGALIRGASAEIDAVVSAHTHQTYACTVPIDGSKDSRPVIQAAEYGKAMGELQLQVDRRSKELLTVSGRTFTLAGTTATPDAAVAKIVTDAAAVAATEGAAPVGRISADILRGGTKGSDRGVESALGNTVADVYLWATSNGDYAGAPAQIALMNPGGLRADLERGTDGVVTYKEAAEVQPFANTLVTVTLTGAQIEKILEQQWKATGDRPKLHLGVSEGFTYEYTEVAPLAGETVGRAGDVTAMTYRGTPITASDTFTVVTNSFLAGGGDGFATFAEGTDRTDTGQIDLAATVAYFGAFDVVDPAPLGRAVPAADAEPNPGTDPETPGEETPGEETPGTETPGTETPDAETPGTDGDPAAGGGTGDGSVTGPDGGELASTGGDAAPLVGLLAGAGALIAVGLVLMRRRRSRV